MNLTNLIDLMEMALTVDDDELWLETRELVIEIIRQEKIALAMVTNEKRVH